jgi:acylphosphatase
MGRYCRGSICIVVAYRASGWPANLSSRLVFVRIRILCFNPICFPFIALNMPKIKCKMAYDEQVRCIDKDPDHERIFVKGSFAEGYHPPRNNQIVMQTYIRMTMKLKVKITGPKVHDVGYRYFLMSMAMANRIRMFEAHNIESGEGEEVLVFADGDEEGINVFRAQAETKRPAHSEVSNIVFDDDFEGEVMKIGEYAQFCATVQLNKAIPVLLEIRDNTKATPQILEEIKGMREDIQPGYASHFRQMQSDIRAIKDRLGM